MKKAVIFDWSGTLSDNFHLFCKVFDRMCAHFGRGTVSVDEIRSTVDVPYMKFWNIYFPALAKSEEDVLYKKFIHEVGDPVAFPGVKDFLLSIKKRGWVLFVISSDNPSTLLPELSRYGLGDCFAEVVSSVHEKEHAIRDLVSKHSLNQETTFYVGDTPGDVEAGKLAGVKTIGVTWGFVDRKRILESKPSFVVGTFEELEWVLL